MVIPPIRMEPEDPRNEVSGEFGYVGCICDASRFVLVTYYYVGCIYDASRCILVTCIMLVASMMQVDVY